MRSDAVTAVRDALRVLQPKPCPVPLVRLGGDLDGAYLVPDDLDGVNACFSPGVNNFKRFEDELAERYGIKSHLCDFTSDASELATPLVDGMQTFEKKWLDVDGSPHSISLLEWVHQWSPDAVDDLILQMDIEGAEYRNLLGTPQDLLERFRVIVIELHGLDAAKDPVTFEDNLGPLLRKLDKSHICVHVHPNNCCGEFILEGTALNVPNLIEATFLRRDRISASIARQSIPPKLPHPDDIRRNVDHLPPLFLNAEWLGGSAMTDSSRIKILEDLEDYYRTGGRLQRDRQTLGTVFALLRAPARPRPGAAAHNSTSVTREVARGSRYRLSSVYGGDPIEGLIHDRKPYFFHTDFGVAQGITVDLGAAVALSSIVLVNRTDMCYDRARYAMYCLHDEPEPDYGYFRAIDVQPDFLEPLGDSCETAIGGLVSRYVTIFSPEDTALHLSGLRVFAAEIDGSSNLRGK